MIEFFIPLEKIPTTTKQQHRVTFRNEKPVFFNTKAIDELEEELTYKLKRYAQKFVTGEKTPLKVVVWWRFNYKRGHNNGEYKTTRPDLDNMFKLPADIMTKLGFWHDDSQLSDVQLIKTWDKNSGIYIKIEELTHE